MRDMKAAVPECTADDFTWFSNPLDWRAIDRQILLGALVMLVPGMFGFILAIACFLTPDHLNLTLVLPLLAAYGVNAVLLTGFLVKARQKRRHSDAWPAFENFIIASFLIGVLSTAWLTGTHFAEGLMLLFLGINISSALADIRKVRIAYLWGCAAMAVFALIDFSDVPPSAPLLAKPQFNADGTLAQGWLVVRVVLATILLAISAISMAAIGRWVERENLYREMSNVDGLTRLTNRRSFIERGQSELSRAKRFGDSPLACIMVDLDHFKKINDTYGHHAGDQVLVTASATLMESRRQYDEVGRYGCEEFAILLPGATAELAVNAAERIRARIAGTPVEVDGHCILITASFGVASYPADDINDLNDLLKAADKALYDAKESGRNRVCLNQAARPTSPPSMS